MSIICPTVTAFDIAEYNTQIKRLALFADRVHIDLMDGKFAPTTSPGLDEIWWPPVFTVDLHMMYENPENYIEQIILLQPNLVVIHAEAPADHMLFAAKLHQADINAGLAIGPETTVSQVEQILHSFDHLLIYSGHLGRFGGEANLELLNKISEAKAHYPQIEIGWDGGINAANAKHLSESGVEVLNVGGFIQKAENPEAAYNELATTLSGPA
jgi:ribulose-phosphate 3-epimerase